MDVVSVVNIHALLLDESNDVSLLPKFLYFLTLSSKVEDYLCIRFVCLSLSSRIFCVTPKFICSSDDGVTRLLITENDISYKSNVY